MRASATSMRYPMSGASEAQHAQAPTGSRWPSDSLPTRDKMRAAGLVTPPWLALSPHSHRALAMSTIGEIRRGDLYASSTDSSITKLGSSSNISESEKTTLGDNSSARTPTPELKVEKDISEYFADETAGGEEQIPDDDPLLRDIPWQVRRVVSLEDDPTAFVITFRFFFLMFLFIAPGAVLTQMDQYRTTYAPYSVFFVQIASHYVGDWMGKYLPAWQIRVPFTKWGFNLNPGPFSVKEHVMVTIAASTGATYNLAFAPISMAELYFDTQIHWAVSITFMLAVTLVGYSYAALARQFLINDPQYPWLCQAALFETQKKQRESPSPVSRKQMLVFFLVLAGVTIWQFLPEYVFPFLQSLAFLCWVAPHNETLNFIGSGAGGMGFLNLSLDWSTISNNQDLGSLFLTPWWTQVIVFIGFIVSAWIAIPLVKWGGVSSWPLHLMSNSLFMGMSYLNPFRSSLMSAANGTEYPIHAIMTSAPALNETAYAEYGPLYVSAQLLWGMFFQFASYTSAMVWMAIFGYPVVISIIRKYKERSWNHNIQSVSEQFPDQLNVLMRQYKEVPFSWYFALFLISVVMIFGVVAKGDLYIPTWTVVVALATGAVVVVPLGWLYAVSNFQLPIGTTNELLYGIMVNSVSGYKNPCGAFVYSSIAGNAWYRAQLMLQDQKVGHYMHIPPRAVFFSQILGSLIGVPINYGTMRWVLDTKSDYLKGKIMDPTKQWTGQVLESCLTVGVQYVLVGPARLFKLQIYHAVPYGFLLGGLTPLIIYCLHRRFPNAKFMLWNSTIFYSSIGSFWGNLSTGVTSSIIGGYFVMYYAYRHHYELWARYNYILAAAFDAGFNLCLLIIFLAFGSGMIINMPNCFFTVVGARQSQDDLDFQAIKRNYIVAMSFLDKFAEKLKERIDDIEEDIREKFDELEGKEDHRHEGESSYTQQYDGQGYQKPHEDRPEQPGEEKVNNRFGSFAPQRSGNDAKWFVDGCGYFWAVSIALEEARESIWILDWWLSPELYLRRPPSQNEQYRIDRMLLAAAERGVKVNIIVYKEVSQVLTLCSEHTKKAIEQHPNISVFRHPDHAPSGQVFQSEVISKTKNFFKCFDLAKLPEDGLKAIYGASDDIILYWAHHEKLCLIDGRIAFMGGLDLCFGRWDTNSHPLADAHPTNVDKILFPGQDFNNARVYDFEDVTHYMNNKLDRTQSSRMGWSDLSLCLQGPVVEDLRAHFVQRWNFIFKEKYDVPEFKTKYTSLSLRQEDIPDGYYKLNGKVEGLEIGRPQPSGVSVQLVRSCTTWSNGCATEHSVANAYIEVIRNSRSFVYIENQFFITATGDKQSPIKNQIGAALVERIVRAYQNGEQYKVIVCMPSVPAFAGDLHADDSLGTRAIMEYQYNSICRGGHSIIEEIQKAGVPDAGQYIRFYNLRNYDRINAGSTMSNIEQQSGVSYRDARREHDDIVGAGYDGYGEGTGARPGQPNREYDQYQAAASRVQDSGYDTVSACYMDGGPSIEDIPWSGDEESEMDAFVSEELYIHTKLLIADDTTVICGSANLNDRSQLGTHDSEIAVVIHDNDLIPSTLAYQPVRVSRYATSLRRQLFRKHLGLLPDQDFTRPDENFLPINQAGNIYDWGSEADNLVADPLSEEFSQYWNGTASTNTAVFARAFHVVPADNVTNWEEYEQFYGNLFFGGEG
ncbi:hypothetical protein G7Y89_g1882 [Cudoniella acicularis]|uniref:PLD phosphodiesterase domain-containing protein n=1 Tax=Cudoniella acicularis TaxID=354080 RepID=A0A8H4RW71_9HELO|nr:hypothetical protein G7Y89_g1882 [Cudoniella acicularis]